MHYINREEINELHIELSSQCRLRCKHCSSESMLKEEHAQCSLAQLSRFLEYFYPPCHIYFTGGEPMLSPMIYEGVRVCKDRGFSVGLFSTFYIDEVEEAMSALQRLRLDDIYFSIYDNCARGHDDITGTEGSFDNTMHAIHLAKDSGIQPKINLVLLKTNIERIHEIILYFDRMGLSEIRLLKLVDHGRATRNWDQIGLSLQEQARCAEEIYHRFGDGVHTKLTYSGFPSLTHCRPFDSCCSCGAANTLLYITADGTIYPCASQKNDPSCIIGHIDEPLTIQYPALKSRCFLG